MKSSENERQRAIRERSKSGKVSKKSSKLGMAVILVVVFLICGFIYWKTRSLKSEVDSLNQQVENIETQIEDAKRENVAINNEIKYRQTDDYIKDQARDTFGLRDEDETIFLPGNTD